MRVIAAILMSMFLAVMPGMAAYIPSQAESSCGTCPCCIAPAPASTPIPAPAPQPNVQRSFSLEQFAIEQIATFLQPSASEHASAVPLADPSPSFAGELPLFQRFCTYLI